MKHTERDDDIEPEVVALGLLTALVLLGTLAWLTVGAV